MKYLVFLSIFLGLACGRNPDSELKIVGGSDVPRGTITPAFGFVVKGGSVGGAFKAEVCSGVRVKTNAFLTTIECAEQLKKANRKILFLASTEGSNFSQLEASTISTMMLPILKRSNEISQASEGIALFSLEKLPENIDDQISVAEFSSEEPHEGLAILGLGAGCDIIDGSGECTSYPTIVKKKPMKYFQSKISATEFVKPIFYSKPNDGRIALGDEGGPVFVGQTPNQLELIGLNVFIEDELSADFKVKPAYLWLGDDEVQNFINHPGVDPADPLAEDPFFTGLSKHVQKSYDDLSACGFNTDYPVFDKLRINRDLSPGLCTIAIDRREAWVRMQSTALMLADMAVDAYLKGEIDKAKELRKKSIKLFLTALDFGLGLIPVIGDMKDILECMTGHKATTIQKLKTGEWIGACMGVIIGNRQIWVEVFDGIRMSGKYLSYLKKFLPENLSYMETYIAQGAKKLINRSPLSRMELQGLIPDIHRAFGIAKNTSDILLQLHDIFKLVSEDEIAVFLKGLEKSQLFNSSQIVGSDSFSVEELHRALGIAMKDSSLLWEYSQQDEKIVYLDLVYNSLKIRYSYDLKENQFIKVKVTE